jgi:hypothetical protein
MLKGINKNERRDKVKTRKNKGALKTKLDGGGN